MATPTYNPSDVHIEAHLAGMAALEATTPVPMTVSDDPTYTKPENIKSYYVPEGVCGFAWIEKIRANSKMGKWLIDREVGRKSSEGGVTIWCRYGNQSLELKSAYIGAYSGVLTKYGIKHYTGSRMD